MIEVNFNMYFLLFFALSQQAACQEGCLALNAANQTAYYNWPVFFGSDCELLAFDCRIYSTDYRCRIKSEVTNETLLVGDYDYYDEYGDYSDHPSYEIKNVTADSPTLLSFTVQGQVDGERLCCTKKTRIEKEQLPHLDCDDIQERCSAAVSDTSPSDIRKFMCRIPGNSNEPRLNNLQAYSIRWFHNCNASLPNGVSVDSSNNLVIPSFDQRFHPGNYSCAIDYNGEIRRVAEYCVCAKPRAVAAKISVLCSTDRLRYSVGDTAVISCNVNIGNAGVTFVDSSIMTFYPLLESGEKDISKDNMSCIVGLGASGANSKRVKCSYQVVNTYKPDCFFHPPTEEEWARAENKTLQHVVITYILSDLQETDFGLYQAYAGTSSGKNNDTDVARISMDLGEREKAVRIAIAVGITAVILILIACLIYFFRLHIRVTWKRSSCVNYEKGLMEYGAYLTYFWSNQEDGDSKAASKYKDLISEMRKSIERSGFKIYDQYERPQEYQWKYENVHNLQGRCDRVIVILTSKFLDEPDAKQILFMNFLQQKFILITTPEFESGFKKLQKNVQNGLNAHFQRNRKIQWSGRGGKLSKRMQMELELAMPKKREDGGFPLL